MRSLYGSLLDDDKEILERARVRNSILSQIHKLDEKYAISSFSKLMTIVLQCDVEDHPGFIFNFHCGSDFINRCCSSIYGTLEDNNLLSRNFTLTLIGHDTRIII